MKFRVKKDEPSIGEGRYKARFADFKKEHSQWAPGRRFTFMLLDKQHKGMKAETVAWMKTDKDGEEYVSEGSPLHRMLAGVVGSEDLADVTDKDVKACIDDVYYVEVIHNTTKDGRTFANVDSVEAASKKDDEDEDGGKKKSKDDDDDDDDGGKKKDKKKKKDDDDDDDDGGKKKDKKKKKDDDDDEFSDIDDDGDKKKEKKKKKDDDDDDD